jgi:AcrR family transcriptional regulator
MEGGLMTATTVETTEERIRRVATELFYEQGYHGTTMRDIAAGVGIKAGSLYNHFPSKEEILLRICDDTIGALHGGADERLEGIDDIEERLRALIVWHVEFHASHRHAARVTDGQLHALDADKRAHVIELRDAYERLLKELLAEGVREGRWVVEDLTVVAIGIATMCTEVDAWYREDGPLTPTQIGEIFAEFNLNGLRGGG